VFLLESKYKGDGHFQYEKRTGRNFMKSYFIKRIIPLLSITLLLSSLTGCGSKKTESDSNKNNSTSGTSIPSATSTSGLPIVKDKITLTYWVPLDSKYSATIKNFNDQEMHKELEKRTGIHIDFQHPVAGQETEQFNLMVASGSLPDIIEMNWTGKPGGPDKALQDGVIIDMTSLIDKYAPNYKAILQKYPQANREITTRTGKQYMMTGLYTDDEMKIMVGPQIRQDWLTKLGLQMPQTINDWYTALKAFKEKDPNGNGKPDEIPLLSRGYKVNVSLLENVGLYSSAWGIHTDFFNLDGKVKFGAIQPEYKEFLKEMNKWYKEGLIDADFATTDKKMFDSKITEGRAGAWVAGLMGDMGKYLTTFKAEKPDWKLVAAPYPKQTASGTAYNFNSNMNEMAAMMGANITKANKYPVETTKWFDYAYTTEGNLLYNLGIEGLTYKMVNGKPEFTDTVLKNPQGWDVTTALGHYCRGAATTGAHMPELAIFDMRASQPEQLDAKKKIWKAASIARTMPSVIPADSESQRMASILNEVYTYTNEMSMKFIMGIESIDNFEKYVENLKKMKIEDAVAIKQKALDDSKAK
jgi:putative aldouronate transport system substrate-binding protein